MVNSGVLVLNRNWTAIHVCNVKRALVLLCQDLARVVTDDYQTHDFNSWRQLSVAVEEHGNYFIHTPRFRMLIPEVIILTGFHRLPPRTVKFNRRNIYVRDNFTCQYCACKPPREELTIDHIVPRSRGGRSTWENVVLACQECNARKGDKNPSDLGMKLLSQPKRPHWLSTLRHSARSGSERSLWMKFVDVAYWNVTLDEV